MSPTPDSQLVEPLRLRRSLRAYKPDAVSPEQLQRCLEAARWAASCFNGQPWRFLIGDRHQNSDVWQSLFDVLAEGNQKWCKRVPVLLLACAQPHYEHNDKENPWYVHDLGQALANFAIQATAESLTVHMMAGFDADDAAKLIDTDNLEPWTMVALGYHDRPDVLDEDWMLDSETGERKRKPLHELVLNADVLP